MNWTDKDVLNLIEQFKCYRCLWDPTDKDKKNRVRKNECYREIGYKFGTSGSEIKRKIHNVLQSYRGYRRKIKSKQLSGDYSRSYKPNWFAFWALHEFMENAYRPTEEPETLIDSDVDNTKRNYAHQNSGEVEESAEATETHTESNFENTGQSSYKINLKRQRKRTGWLPQNKIEEKRKRKNNIDEDSNISMIYEYFQQKIRRNDKLEKENDECDLYAKLVSIKLKKMDEISRQCAMHEMDNIMFRCLSKSQNYLHFSNNAEETTTSGFLMQQASSFSRTSTTCEGLPPSSHTFTNGHQPISTSSITSDVTSTPTLSLSKSPKPIRSSPEISFKEKESRGHFTEQQNP